MKRQNLRLFLFLGILLIVFSFRFIHLSADPPSNLSSSMGYIGDPGGYAFNARNKLVLGQWEIDMWNLRFISPLPHYITFSLFAILGPGIASMNLVPVLFSCLILIVTFFLLRRNLDFPLSLLGTFLFGVNYQFLMFSRIAVRVMPMLFFLLLALYFLERKNHQNLFLFLAGTSCFVSFTVKGTALQFIPSFALGLALYLVLKNKSLLKKTLPSLFIFVSGHAFVFVLWLIFYYFPNKEMFTAYGGENISWLTPHGLLEALNNFWRRPLFFLQEMPIMTLLSTVYILLLSFKVFANSTKISVMEWICAFWIVSNSLYFAVIQYHAARHFVALVPPLVILSISLLRDVNKIERIEKPASPSPFPFLLLPILLVFPVSSLIKLVSSPASQQEVKAKSFLTLGISLACTLAIYFLIKFWPRNFHIHISIKAKRTAFFLLIFLSVFFNGKKYLDWALHPRHNVRDISQDLGKAFDKMVIAGLLGPVITLENRHEAHPYRSGYINPYEDFLRRFSVSHLFVTRHAGEIEKRDYERDFPDALERARLVARYPIGFTYAELYELNPPSFSYPEDTAVYEGEIFFDRNGIPRFDPAASGRLALCAEKSRKGFSFELPLQEQASGNYQATFRLKIKDTGSEDKPLVRLVVFDSRRKKILVSKDLNGSDFHNPGFYQDFVLPFSLKTSTPLYLRLLSTGEGEVWVDRVTIRTRTSESSSPLARERD